MEQHPAICSVHHVHIWALSSSQNALTVHLVVDNDISLLQIEQIKKELRHTLEHQNVQHTTFEVELSQTKCTCKECS